MPLEFYSCFIPAAEANPARRQALAEHMLNLNDEALEDFYPDAQEMDRDDLTERAEEYWDLDGRKDVNIITLPGSAPHFVSGGMSFGDDPTDSFETILFLGRVHGL